MEVPLPQLSQVCVAILLSSTLFRIPRRTICWSTSPTVFAFVFSTVFCFFFKTPTFKNLSPSKHCRSIIGSRDTSVYLPTRSGATNEFKEALDLLDATLGFYSLDNDVYILGDLNADLGTEGGPQACTPANEHGHILLRYLRRWKYLSYHLHLSPSQSTHTYESEAHGSLSTIDHFLGPSHMLSSISKCVVAEEDPINTSDQFPILAELELCFYPHAASSPVEPQNQTLFGPNWDKVSPMEIEALYTIPIEEQLNQIKCPTLEECLETPTLIDQHLTTLTTLMLQTAYNSIPPKKYSPHKKQGWNDELCQAQRAAQQAYKAWRAAGKPRNPDHPMRNHYKSSKGRFHSLLRQHKREECENFFASLDLHNTDPQKLFRTIRQKNGH